MTETEYVTPPKKILETEYVTPPKKVLETEYVAPPKKELEVENIKQENIAEQLLDNQTKDILHNVEGSENNIEKAKNLYVSIRDHLDSTYRKRYNIRRVFSCVIFLHIVSDEWRTNEWVWSGQNIFWVIWTLVAFIFWHYAFWWYKDGGIDNFLKTFGFIGSIGSVIWYLVIQYTLLYLLLVLIAPVIGILTWRKAVKRNVILYVNDAESNKWGRE